MSSRLLATPRTDPATWVPLGAVVVLACWCAQQMTWLPPLVVAVFAVGLGLVFMGSRWWLRCSPIARVLHRRGLRLRAVAGLTLLAGVFVGSAGVAVIRAQSALAERIPPSLEGIELVVVGVIEAMPLAASEGWRTVLRIQGCEAAPPQVCPEGARVRLHWPGPKVAARGRVSERPSPDFAPLAPFRPGERWRVAIKMRRALAPQNPGLFDAELRHLEEGIAGLASVRAGAKTAVAPQRLTDGVLEVGTLIESMRTALRDAMDRALRGAADPVRGVLVALVVGDQSAIAGPWWERFNRTGVGHLMSISGLHITMLAGLGVWVVRRLWRARLPAWGASLPWMPSRYLPLPHAGWIGGVLVGFGYAALAGWGLPAQRTCWMLAAAGLALISGRARDSNQVLCTAAAVVCLLDPWAPMAAGFWLSFAAVAAIIWHGSRLSLQAPGGRWSRLWQEALRSQVAATVCLLPLGVLFFSSVSLVSPLANALAIPLVSGLITPMALFGALAAFLPEPLGSWPLQLGAWLVQGLLAVLTWCDDLPWSAVTMAAPSSLALLLAALACVLLLAPWPVPGRALAWVGLLPLVLSPVRAPAPGELWITALDIGQGMAVLVETPAGRLLYDTGPAWGADNDAGARIVAPYLRARGISHLQAMVVSHRDSDHAGGAMSLLRQLRIDWVASSLDDTHPVVQTAARHHVCRRDQSWQWGEVRFEWLHPGDDPPPTRKPSSNARSCVLRVQSPAGSVLLAGDIEAAQEAALIARLGSQGLMADLLLAPHHGSNSSSSAAFLRAVSPHWAIFQVGYRNRFGHPTERVLDRYREQGIDILRTDRDGAIVVSMRSGQGARIERARIDSQHYWRLRMPPEGP